MFRRISALLRSGNRPPFPSSASDLLHSAPLLSEFLLLAFVVVMSSILSKMVGRKSPLRGGGGGGTGAATPRRNHSKHANENIPPDDHGNNMISPFSFPEASLSSKSCKSNSNGGAAIPPRPPQRKTQRKICNEFEAQEQEMVKSDNGVEVIVRIRPLTREEAQQGPEIAHKLCSNSVSAADHHFTFDAVAGTESTQEEMFEMVGVPLVDNCFQGFNSSIFAYGQTGSGKTYTMWGPSSTSTEDKIQSRHRGITPRVFEKLFARIQEEEEKNLDKQMQHQCRCSFLEIYNEQITDLLEPSQRNLQIREDTKCGLYVENMREEYVTCLDDVNQLLFRGLSNRRVGATSINAESSRSHCVFTCVVESSCKRMSDGLSVLRTSKINLVDLAGSERQKLTGAAGDRLKEAGNINRSLSQLGNLINILSEVTQGKQRHIPYRDSRLTFLLQESLGGNAKLAMICAISPASSCKNETLSTLRFAKRAKAIQNKAVVNEETENDVNSLREQIRMLKYELLRMKSNGDTQVTSSYGGYSTGWNARRSFNALRMSLNRPMTLQYSDADNDEDMEIDETDVEKLDAEPRMQSKDFDGTRKGLLISSSSVKETSHLGTDKLSEISVPKDPSLSPNEDFTNPTPCALVRETNPVKSHDVQSPMSTIPCDLSPTLQCSILSASPRIERETKNVNPKTGSELLSLSFNQSLTNTSNIRSSILSNKPLTSPTECLAASLHRGLEIIDHHQQNSSLRKSSVRFSFKMLDAKAFDLVDKVDVGVQTSAEKCSVATSPIAEFLCACNGSNTTQRSPMRENVQDKSDWQLVAVGTPKTPDGSKLHLSRAVESVVAGAIRREMALEETCNKQAAEIEQLNRLVRQYKHERECNFIIQRSREDKIIRLESLMDGVISKEDFLNEEFLSLMDEHKVLTDKYENHPEVTQANIEQKRLMEELEKYRNFYELGERDALLDEIQHLRSQLLSQLEPGSSLSLRKGKLSLTPHSIQRSEICESNQSLALSGIREIPNHVPIPTRTEAPTDTDNPTAEEPDRYFHHEKWEEEKQQWIERESEWISLAEELRADLDSYRRLAEKRKQDVECEKRCSEELKEALQMAMEGHARLLDQYAELQEKHIALLARHRKIKEGVTDVKRAAAKVGAKGSQLRFIEAQAAELVALKLEREREQKRVKEEIKGLQDQLRDTAEAVQAAGELLVRLKEAEETVAIAQDSAAVAEQHAEIMHRQMEKLNRKHATEMAVLNQRLLETRLHKSSVCPMCQVADRVKFEFPQADETILEAEAAAKEDASINKSEIRGEYEPFPHADSDFLRMGEPTSWFSDYDRCNL